MNNNRQAADLSLTTFGGLCTEASPSDLPEGASPQNWDVDFDIGSVYTRDGLQPVYSFSGLSAGPNPPGLASSNTVSGKTWGNPQNVLLNDSLYSTVSFNAASPALSISEFGFALALSAITGIQVQVFGHCGGSASVPNVTLRLLVNGVAVGNTKSGKLPVNTDGSITLGGSADTWGAALAYTDINHVNFGVQLVGTDSGSASLAIQHVTIKVFQSSSLKNFNYLKSFVQDNGQTTTFALDASGTLWDEDVTNNPGVLSTLTENILPGSFAQSSSAQNEEWIAFSNLIHGTDLPRHGSNLDRISQAGPGAGPAVSGISSGTNTYPIAASPSGITQIAANSDPASPGHFQAVNWSAGPTSTSPGNVLTIFYRQGTPPGPDPHIIVGQAIYISLLSGVFAGLNGTYIIRSTGFAIPPGGGANRWYFTVQTVATGNAFVGGPDTMTGQYQVTLTTLTTVGPANIQVGNQVTIAAAGIAGWDGTWTITATLNGGQYQVTSTQLTGGVATYTYTLISGVAPSVGDQVTVTGCTNGPIVNGSSVFNVANAMVNSVAAGSFTVLISAANVTSAAETANAVDSGTIFQFDPGLSLVGTVTNPIFGNSGGGTVSTGGNIGAGIRSAVTIFETRNGYQTAPSPPTVFGTTGSANTLSVSHIAVGPPNVVRRIIAFTGNNGANFFYIPDPVTITGIGQAVTYTATVLNDNISTSATFTFTDTVLLAATAIDIQGNNLFNQLEIGAPAWTVAYASRMFYGLANNKLQNFVNMSFDGGYLPLGASPSYPLGWTVDSTNGSGGRLNVSPIFGNSYYVQNTTGVTQANLGIIYQSAYQDSYGVPILQINTLYSVRASARCPSGIANGNLNLQLYSPSFAKIYGNVFFSTTLMTSQFQVFTVPFVTTAFTTSIPPDLQFRVIGWQLQNGGDVECDYIELFPTNQPALNTDIYASYIDNLEAVDGVTGILGVGGQNNQRVLGAFVNYDILYFLKSGSLLSTQDSSDEEPSQWRIREVSNKIGTCGIHAYDSGEEWMVTACRQGLYLFNGGEPIKLSQENQPIWDAINWTYGHTIVVRNDIAKRRITVQIPLPTPNQWLPNAPLNANPTTPNVMLMMSYKELNSSLALADRTPIKLAFSGKLIAWDISRKWSIWQIASPYSAFITRPDGTEQWFVGNGMQNSKIYELSSNAISDDGMAINGLYTTYGFLKADQAQQYGPLVGQYRKLYRYSSHNLEGSGMLQLRMLQNTLDATYPYTVPGGLPLVSPAQNTMEVPLNLSAQRLYAEYSTNDPAAQFRLSEVVMSLVKEPWAGVRGVN